MIIIFLFAGSFGWHSQIIPTSHTPTILSDILFSILAFYQQDRSLESVKTSLFQPVHQETSLLFSLVLSQTQDFLLL